MADTLKMQIQSKADNEAFARAAVAAFITRINPTLEEINDVKTAVSEAVTNVVVHGYDSEEGIISLNVQIDNNTVKITVEDYGKGIDDVKRAREPLYTTKPDEERSGMGFTFMEIFMDELTVESAIGKGTTVHMSKIIKGGK
jgi:stage II sporulation protein AB (anti-sigma F factor)